MKPSLQINCRSKYEFKIIVTLLLALGVNHYNGNTDPDSITDGTYKWYNSICVTNTFCGCHDNYNGDVIYTYKDLGKIIEFITGTNEIIVKNVGDYNAVITKENVTVGCQTFPIDIIDNLVKAKNQL